MTRTLPLPGPASRPTRPADLLLLGGGVFDGERHLPAGAVVVTDGRVTAVVPDATGLVGRGTEVVDVAGGLVLPGFQDAHVHPVQGGLERIRCDLSELDTREEYVDAVAGYARARPAGEWVLGGGWAMPAFGPRGPRAEDLDRVVGDRPVFLPNRDHHGAWVSSAALRLAGVDRHTPDPRDGRIERDPDGSPTGTLHEGAMALVQRWVPSPAEADYDRALAEAQAFLHGVGVTAWQDAIWGAYAGIDDPASTYLRALADGRLTARVRGALWWDRTRGLEQVRELVERSREIAELGRGAGGAGSGGRVVAGAVKIMQDGVAENYTAAMTAPYRDGCGGHHADGGDGLSFVDPELLREAVVRLDAAGLQVHVHAIGDRAVREALDSFDAARRVNGPGEARHHIAHVQVVHPHDRARFAALDVAVNMQALWAVNDDQMRDLTLPYLPEGAAGWQYPFGSLAAAGARLAAGSDWPVSSPDPLAAIHVAVNRVLHGEDGPAGHDPLLPGEALAPLQAFAAYTRGSAWVNHLDDTGRLAPGMRADLAVLDRDPLAGPAGEIGAASVVATYVDGVAVHRR
jgi:predicted amidohydrolase YtcJ